MPVLAIGLAFAIAKGERYSSVGPARVAHRGRGPGGRGTAREQAAQPAHQVPGIFRVEKTACGQHLLEVPVEAFQVFTGRQRSVAQHRRDRVASERHRTGVRPEVRLTTAGVPAVRASMTDTGWAS